MVAKILKSLTPRFSQVVHSIIEAKDLSTLVVDELSSSLKDHESILNIVSDHGEKKALHVRSNHLGEHLHRGSRGRHYKKIPILAQKHWHVKKIVTNLSQHLI